MKESRRLFLLIGIMVGITLTLTAITIFILYNTSLEQMRFRLVELAQSQARLIEAVGRFDQRHQKNWLPGTDDTASATISQVIDAHGRYKGFGKTGEFTLARSNRELEQFAYVASHDLQEPLRMVASYVQLLAKRYEDRLNDDAKDFIRFAVDGATRMQTLIKDLLRYSRVSTRGKPMETVDSQEILGEALANLKMLISETAAMITTDDLPEVLADRSQLVMVFQNLINNAVKFSKTDKTPLIHVGAEKKDREWIFSVKDNGIGIEADYHDRIFAIFQRLHTAKEYPGTGIGLPLCKRIIERHGGRIWMESELGVGSSFYFTLGRIEN